MEELVRRFGAGPVLPEHDPDALNNALYDVADGKWQIEDRSEIDKWLARHTRETLATKLFTIMCGLFDQERGTLSTRAL